MLTNKDILPPPTFLSYSLGCRTNQAEIENISLQLMAYGFTPFNNLCISESLRLCISPSVVLLNTCVVTQKAEKETRQKIRELRKKYPDSFLVVLGCAVTAKEKYKINLPKADLLISNEEKPQTSSLILNQIHAKLSDSINVRDNPLLNKYQLSGRKFIKIQDGCNKFCSFCITSLIRGKPTSVPPQEIIKEINFWVGKGIKEIILTGINIGLWGKDFKKQETRLAARQAVNSLIEKILLETKVERLSFSSIDPEMLLFDRSDLLTGRTCLSSLTVNNLRITQCFHLSLQSGSPSVLERMNRKTDLCKLMEILQWIKHQNPYFTFRADIIVGFPDETEKEFQETLDFVKKAKIAFVHSFQFSVRPDTKVEVLINNKKYYEVPMEVKKERMKILGKVVKKIRNNEAMKQLNNKTSCLVIRKRNDQWEGITENGWPILVQSSKLKVKSFKGKILPVKIVNFDENYLLGKIVSLPT